MKYIGKEEKRREKKVKKQTYPEILRENLTGSHRRKKNEKEERNNKKT